MAAFDPKAELAAELVKDLPPLLTIPEAAKALRVSVRSIHRFLACRRLQAARYGSGKGSPVRVLRSSVAAFLATTID